MAKTERRDYEALARALVRQLRGRRSRVAVSRRLGYSTNALFTWEMGSAWPSASRFLEYVRVVGVPPQQLLARFFRETPPRLKGKSLASNAGVQAFLLELMGKTRITALAQSSGLSRFSLSRWLSGKAQPRLPELLCFIEHASMRLLDFLDALTDVTALPDLAAEWSTLQAARNVGYEFPMSHAVLRALETAGYAATDGSPRQIARLLGVEAPVVEQCLERLAAAKQVRRHRGRWSPVASGLVDFRRDPDAAQRVKAHWAKFAAERTLQRRPGLFAYNVFAVSREDLARLEALQREYLRQMRTIIAESEPSDVVALLNTQLFAFQD